MRVSQLRTLNDEGVKRFSEWLEKARTANLRPGTPDHLLGDERFSIPVSMPVELPLRVFSTVWEAAESLSVVLGMLQAHEVEGNDGLGSRGLWSWLALFYLDQLCPTTPGATNRYIPEIEGGAFRYYRHLLAGPFRLHRQLGELVKPALTSSLSEHNALYNALADHQDLVQNPAVVEVMNHLYFDAPNGKVRQGASSAKRAGSLRRFFPVMHQLEMTYDLLGMSSAEIIKLLPSEFNAWVPERPLAEVAMAVG